MQHDIAFLDFLRGWAALLVFFHHASILGGGPSFLSGHIGQEAVNAFMLASGFLIYFQCSIGKTYHLLSNKEGIKNFYIRRFFRIAPAYYVSLIVALVLSDNLGFSREIIAETLPSTATNMDRYYIENKWESFLIHISFVFGAIPSYSFSTPLPDWSLGLEMQFYAFFPALFFFFKRSFLKYYIFFIMLMFGIWFMSNQEGLIFPMPSYLPLKFHNFAAGIALSHLLLNQENESKYHQYIIVIITIVALYFGNQTGIMPILFLFSWWWVCRENNVKEGRLVSIVHYMFTHKSSKILAEISYSLYIFHLILMLPFFAYILKGRELSSIEWILSSLVLLFLSMGFSYLIYKYVEIPGIKMGKKQIKSLHYFK